VILTIMLNYVAYYLVFFALSEQSLLQAPNSVNPKSLPAHQSATMPKLLGDRFKPAPRLPAALVAVAVVWWILNRSSLGFRIRAVGANPAAARSSGIDVGRTYTVVMMISGALVGLAGANQVLGTGAQRDHHRPGRRHRLRRHHRRPCSAGRDPSASCFAGLLFGAFKAGGLRHAGSRDIPVDIVLVVQSLIVLFIAAPALVRAIFRLPAREAA